ncbi:MAG TPA: cyclic nucleotide-binding domain-containing protein [Myxococcota bacterium]|nr:cyclic nucleotide-binding domain-containing protein [Myxococcota bacterium]
MAGPIHPETLQRFAQNSKLLSLLDVRGIERLARAGTMKIFPAGTMIVSQGESGQDFYLIAVGEVRVLVAEAGDKEVARLGPGMFFGEMAVISRQPRSASVETTQSSQLICFQREPVVHILRDYPKVREFLGSVGLARTEENINKMLEDDADGGLADLLESDDEALPRPEDLPDVMAPPPSVAPRAVSGRISPAPDTTLREQLRGTGAPPPAPTKKPTS